MNNLGVIEKPKAPIINVVQPKRNNNLTGNNGGMLLQVNVFLLIPTSNKDNLYDNFSKSTYNAYLA